MKQRQRIGTFVLILVLVVVPGGTGCGSVSKEDPIRSDGKVVKQIDHILIKSDRAEKLFDILATDLRLPVAWPMEDFGGFASGGVTVGNVDLEVIRTKAPGARIAGFAIEPEPLSVSLRILDERRVPYGPPAQFRTGGFLGIGGKTRWTTTALPSVSSDVVEIFLCEYPDDVSLRRRKWAEELQSRDGGPLSITGVGEIVLGGRDAAEMNRRWQELLSPMRASAPGLWKIGSGPGLRIVEAPEDGILGIRINVRSLSRAREYLSAKGMIGEERDGEITLGGPEFEGLTVRIVSVDRG